MSEAGKVVRVIGADGTEQELDPTEAQQAFVQSGAQLPLGVPVTITRDGVMGEVDPEHVQEWLDKGWRFADRTDVLRSEAKEQNAQALLEGFASEMTYGMSDLALSQMGVEGLQERRELNPWADLGTGLGIAGQVAGAFLTGGTSTAVAGAASKGALRSLGSNVVKGVLAPTRALTAFGDAAAAQAAKAAASVGASQATARIAGQVLGRGLEGATVGFIGGMAEESMGNPEANVEQLLAAGGMGALVGGGIGAVAGGTLQGLSEGLGRLARGKASPVAATGDAVAAELKAAGIPDPDRTLTSRFADMVIENTEKAAKWAYDKGSDIAKRAGFSADDIDFVNTPAAQAFIAAGEQGVNEASAKLGGVIDDISRQARIAEKHLPARPSAVELARRLPSETTAEAVDVVGKHVGDFRQAFKDLEADEELLGLGKGGVKRLLGKANQAIDEMETRVFDMIGIPKTYRGTVTARGALGETLEQQIEKSRTLREVAGLYDLPSEAAAEGFSTLAHVSDVLRAAPTKNAAVKARVKEIVDAIDNSLGDTKIWGETANTVRKLTAARQAQTEAMATLKSRLKFHPETGEVDRGALANYMRTLTRANGADSDAVDAVRKWIAAQQDIVESTTKLVGDPAKLVSELGTRPTKLATEFEAAYQDLNSRVVTFNVLDRLSKQRTDQLGVGVGPIGYAAMGALHGAIQMTGLGMGGLGHMFGAVVSQAAIDPARAAVLRANAKAATDKARETFRSVVGKVLGLPAKALPAEGRAPVALARTTQRLWEAKSEKERREAFRERLIEVAEINSPSAATERNQRLLSAAGHMPSHALALDATAAKAAQILLSAVPASRTIPGGLQPREPKYSDDAIRRFMRLDRAVQDPMGILERAAEDRLTAEDLQVWHELYPNLKAELQAQVIQEMASGLELSRERERVVMKLVGADASPEHADFIRRLQAVHTGAAAAEAPKPRARTAAQSERAARAALSPADRLAE